MCHIYAICICLIHCTCYIVYQTGLHHQIILSQTSLFISLFPFKDYCYIKTSHIIMIPETLLYMGFKYDRPTVTKPPKISGD